MPRANQQGAGPPANSGFESSSSSTGAAAEGAETAAGATRCDERFLLQAGFVAHLFSELGCLRLIADCLEPLSVGRVYGRVWEGPLCGSGVLECALTVAERCWLACFAPSSNNLHSTVHAFKG